MVGLGGEEDLTLRILHPLPNLQCGALVEGLTSRCNWNAALLVLEGSGWVQRMLKPYLFLFTPGLRCEVPQVLEDFWLLFPLFSNSSHPFIQLVRGHFTFGGG